VAFYHDGLGPKTPGVVGTEWEGDEANAADAVVMFDLEAGLTLALYPIPCAEGKSEHSRPRRSSSSCALGGPHPDQAGFVGKDHRLHPIAQSELGEGSLDVGADRGLLDR
jgi:hypothetical protein